jgi:hypothetical protein
LEQVQQQRVVLQHSGLLLLQLLRVLQQHLLAY